MGFYALVYGLDRGGLKGEGRPDSDFGLLKGGLRERGLGRLAMVSGFMG